MPAKLSAVWFPPNERVMSTKVGVNMSILGTVPGFFLPSLFVTAQPLPSDQPHTQPDQESRHDLLMTQLWAMLISMAVLETVLFLVILFFFTEMYENRYGQYSKEKDSFVKAAKTLSDTPNPMEFEN